MSDKTIRKIPYTKPSITELEVQFATDAVAHGWGERCYDYIIRFEEEFKAHLGVKYACLLYTSPSPRDRQKSRMPSSA